MFPNNALEEQLDATWTSGDSLQSWLSQLRRSTLFVPLRTSGTSTSLAIVSMDDHQLVPVFTSEQMLRAATEATFIAPPFSGLVDMLPVGVGLIVNPQTDVSITIPAADLAPGRVAQDPVAVSASRLFIGEPAEEPVEIIAALSRTARDIAAVRQLRRAWVSVDGAEPGLMVGVDLDPDNDEVRAVVTSALRGSLPQGGSVELLFANDRSPIIDWMWSNTQPLHVED